MRCTTIPGGPTGIFETTTRFPPLAVQLLGGEGAVMYPFRVTNTTLTWCTPWTMFPAMATVPPPEAARPGVLTYTWNVTPPPAAERTVHVPLYPDRPAPVIVTSVPRGAMPVTGDVIVTCVRPRDTVPFPEFASPVVFARNVKLRPLAATEATVHVPL